MTNFKTGQKAKVIADLTGHTVELGTEVEILNAEPDGDGCLLCGETHTYNDGKQIELKWHFKPEEVGIVQEDIGAQDRYDAAIKWLEKNTYGAYDASYEGKWCAFEDNEDIQTALKIAAGLQNTEPNHEKQKP